MRGCVCVKELVLAMVSFRDHVWVKQFGCFSSCSSLSGSWAESLLLKGLFHFLLSIFVQQSTLAHQAVAGLVGICWAELRARAYSLCYVHLSVSVPLGWLVFQVKGYLFVVVVFFVNCSSSQFGSLGTGNGGVVLQGQFVVGASGIRKTQT